MYFASLEMPAYQLAARIMASQGNVALNKLRPGGMDAKDFESIAPLWAELSKLPLFFDVTSRTPLEIRQNCEKLARDTGLSLVVVDYVQLMRPNARCANRNHEMESISRDMKMLAMDLHVPVVCLSQLNRSSERNQYRARKSEPSMSDARDSGALEQDADKFLLLYQPEEPPQDECGKRSFETLSKAGLDYLRIKLEKNRQGPIGVVDVGFDKPHMSFVCLQHDY